MKRLLVEDVPTSGKPAPLSPEESGHAIQVMRLANGAEILAIDGKGHETLSKLRLEGKKAFLDFLEHRRSLSSTPSPELILEASILKADAMGWVVEKAVELGAHRLIPIESEYVVVKFKDKGPDLFRERWQRIADQSLKQCERLWSMKVEAPTPLDALLVTPRKSSTEVRLVLDERIETRTSENLLLSRLERLDLARTSAIRILVGPEGGWGERDRKILSNLAQPQFPVHLGEAILRAETACLSGLAQAGAVLERHEKRELLRGEKLS